MLSISIASGAGVGSTLEFEKPGSAVIDSVSFSGSAVFEVVGNSVSACTSSSGFVVVDVVEVVVIRYLRTNFASVGTSGSGYFG